MRVRVLPAVLAVLFAPAARAADDGDPPRVDPDVRPADYQPVPEPPTPFVRVQVRVPAVAAPGKELTYRVVVSNPSPAKAYQVRLRLPVPAGVDRVSRAQPPADGYDPRTATAVPKEVAWQVGTLDPGEAQTFELTVRPGPDARELVGRAFVAFEHGQAVTTRVDKPRLSVHKSAPPQAVGTDPVAVRVVVRNVGRVTATGVRVVEDVSDGFRFQPGDGDPGAGPTQRVWDLGTLRPGEQRDLGYRVTTAAGGRLVARTAVRTADGPDADPATSTTQVLMPDLAVDLKGPAAVGPGQPATYELTVTNTGTLPLAAVRLRADVPDGLTLTKMTHGGRRAGDRVEWDVPGPADGPLKPGQAYAVRFGLTAGATCRRTIRASAAAGRDVERAGQAVTAFQAAAVLSWAAGLDRPTVPAGRPMLLTVRVQNSGGEAARDVQLRVELPPGLAVDQASPRHRAAAGELAFDAVAVPAGDQEKFTVTLVGRTPGPAWVRLKLAADALGEQPLTKELDCEVTAAGQ